MNGKSGPPDKQPRYQRLADSLIGDIGQGVLQVGKAFPGEMELVARYGVSRHTVREALRLLTDLGLIDRRPGIGTVVCARRTTQAYSHTVRTPAELLRYPANSRLHVRSSQTMRVSRKVANELGISARSDWTLVSALRKLRGVKLPICSTDIYILSQYAAVAPLIGRRSNMVYELIEETFGERLVAVEVDVSAALMPAELAPLLQVAERSPSLRIVRRYLGQSRRTFQVTVSHHPADRYSFALELQRGWRSDAVEPVG